MHQDQEWLHHLEFRPSLSTLVTRATCHGKRVRNVTTVVSGVIFPGNVHEGEFRLEDMIHRQGMIDTGKVLLVRFPRMHPGEVVCGSLGGTGGDPEVVDDGGAAMMDWTHLGTRRKQQR